MGGFILESLAGKSWRRDGATYWTRDDAEQEARRILRRGKATQVRVLPVEIGTEPVSTITPKGKGGTP
jgi:hypothetical protein